MFSAVSQNSSVNLDELFNFHAFKLPHTWKMDLPNEDAVESLSAFCDPDTKTLWKCNLLLLSFVLKLTNESDSSSCHPTQNKCNYIVIS